MNSLEAAKTTAADSQTAVLVTYCDNSMKNAKPTGFDRYIQNKGKLSLQPNKKINVNKISNTIENSGPKKYLTNITNLYNNMTFPIFMLEISCTS